MIQNVLLRGTLKLTIVSNAKSVLITINDVDSGEQLFSRQVVPGETIKQRFPAGSKTIDVRTDDRQTIASVDIVRMKTSIVDIELNPEVTLNKVGSGSLGCDILQDNTLYSYACASKSLVMKHNNPLNAFVANTPLYNGASQISGAFPYKNGVIASFEQSDGNSIEYIDTTTNMTGNITLPSKSSEGEYSIIVDNFSDDEHFVLVDDQNGKAYVYKSVTDTSPVPINLPDQKNSEGSSRAYQLLNGIFTVTIGQPDIAGDDDQSIVHKNIITLYDIGTGELKRTVEFPDRIRINSAQLIDLNTVALLDSKGLMVYSIENKPRQVFYSHNINDFHTTGGKLYFTRNNNIFTYDNMTSQAYRVFSSKRQTVSKLSSTRGQFTFNAFTNNDTSGNLSSYALTATPLTSRRLEDTLPYKSSDDLPIIQMDYTSDSIKVQLALTSFTSDRATGKITYDPSEFENAKKLVLTRITEDAIPIPVERIFFTQ
ncbi:MAG TPA: hypothetical protein VF575_04845 [Candidatus Saccharimonadales bacterium]